MIRVLHVTFDMKIGGAQQVIRHLVETMDSAEFEVHIVCIDGEIGEIGELLRQKGFKIYSLDRKSGIDLSLYSSLRQLITKNKYNIIHCHQYTPYFYGLFSAVLTSSRVFFTEHGRFYPDVGSWKRKLLNPLFGLATAKITAISFATKDALVEFENFKFDDIEVVYNGVEDFSNRTVDTAELKNRFRIPSDDLILGTISRLQPIKNQAMMIKVFDDLVKQRPGLHLLIVGDGEARQELLELVQNLNLSSNVTFTGFQREGYLFHKIIDIFLLPSFSEGTSMTLLESMSFAKPSVVTNVGGNSELIHDGVNGRVVDSNDHPAFRDACLSLIDSPELRAALGQAAREKYLKDFTLEKMTRRFEQLYVEAVR